jgi:hypothetical protein
MISFLQEKLEKDRELEKEKKEKDERKKHRQMLRVEVDKSRKNDK